MGYSQVYILNLALMGVGAAQISSIEEASQEALVCKAQWGIAVASLLGMHEWSFAKKSASLAEDASFEMFDERYAYAYKIPTDFLRMTRGTTRPINYERRGDVLVSNESPFKIEYIYRIENPGVLPEYFVTALAAYISSQIALPLAKKGSRAVNYYQLFSIKLDMAKNEDAQQGKETDEEEHGATDQSDTFLSSRT